MRRISILGSTGSIGRSALDVVRRHRDKFEVVALGARSNAGLLAEQAAEFRPAHVALTDPDAASQFAVKGYAPELHRGPAALEEIAALQVDTVLASVVGAVGLHPILRAIDAGNRVALANKEPLVMAGPLIMERARAKGVEIMPVDSEHSAIFQCLRGSAIDDVQCIHLTASGGPFYRRDPAALCDVSPEEAANHPTWDMGTKISVDSSTLMNKGLEVIEAMWLFGLPVSQIHVIIHPQSIVHSMVEFRDGSILAHLGVTDMKFPIEFALMWPERVDTPMERLNLAAVGQLTFDEPDFSAFPCLGYALEAARQGGTSTALLNGANETAVEAFCGRRIGFLQIPEVVGHVLNTCPSEPATSLETVLAADAAARRLAEQKIKQLGV